MTTLCFILMPTLYTGARQVPPGYEDLILHGKFDGFDRRILPGGADKTTQASSIAAISSNNT